MKKPTVHLNGSSGHELLRQNIEARNAVEAAIRLLQEAAPNGRDYYPQGADAWRDAHAEHVDRLKRLQTVSAELQEIIDHVDDQTVKRRHY